MKKKSLQAGFTLIELLIVIAVLGALAAVVVPNVARFLGTANIAAANTEVSNVKTAAMSYLADKGKFPGSSDDLYDGAGPGVDYLSDYPKAKYSIDSNGQIAGVTAVTGGWDLTKMEFIVSTQTWVSK